MSTLTAPVRPPSANPLGSAAEAVTRATSTSAAAPRARTRNPAPPSGIAPVWTTACAAESASCPPGLHRKERPFEAPGSMCGTGVLLEAQVSSAAPARRRTPDGYARERSSVPRRARVIRQRPQPRTTGRLIRVDGGSAAFGSGPTRLFDVRVEGGLGPGATGFAGAVETVLFDPRGWIRSGISLQRVGGGPVDFHVIL